MIVFSIKTKLNVFFNKERYIQKVLQQPIGDKFRNLKKTVKKFIHWE